MLITAVGLVVFLVLTVTAISGIKTYEVVGQCPECNHDVLVSAFSYECSHCAFAVVERIANKAITKQHVKTLLANGQTGLIHGFKSSRHNTKTFSARLKLVNGEVRFVLPEK